ncbi:ergosterol biosynthetic protein 28 isoform X1 [Henckelia pumila]|uniref:ergosterol biosynthetic protein 28 isoform X1 n=1 Tax=Henckelia pumila TaxID=405737 RepID=UPI003C6E3479
MVADACGHASIGFCLVRILRHLGSSPCRFLQDYQSVVFLFFVSEVHGRTFGVWTLLTCTLCFLCAFNLENKPLYLATFLSFVYAFGHFLTEYLIYHTMAIANLTTVGIFAGTSIVWMLLQWNSYQPLKSKHS